ncbi:MAG: hypothetical protein AAGF11_37885 [Myxococcota bacterium]
MCSAEQSRDAFVVRNTQSPFAGIVVHDRDRMVIRFVVVAGDGLIHPGGEVVVESPTSGQGKEFDM